MLQSLDFPIENALWDEEWGKLGEVVVGLWCIVNSVVVFGPQMVMWCFIRIGWKLWP